MASFLLAKSFFAEPKLKAEKTQKNVPHIHTSRRNPDAKPARSSHPNRLRFSATLERFCNDIFMTLSLQSEQPAFNLVTSLVTNWASPLNPAKALVGYFLRGSSGRYSRSAPQAPCCAGSSGGLRACKSDRFGLRNGRPRAHSRRSAAERISAFQTVTFSS